MRLLLFGILSSCIATLFGTQVAKATCVPSPGNMMGWWRFEGNVTDYVPPSSAVLLGPTNFVTGKVGLGLAFDGSSNRLRIPASSKTDVGSSPGFTVEGWIYPTSVAESRPIFHWYTGTSSGVHLFITVGTSANLYANIVTSAGVNKAVSSSGGILQLSTWQHVALTYDKASGIGRIYRNGAIVAEQNLGSFTPQTNHDLVFGHNSVFPNNYFSGRMDEMALYHRALSLEEILSIYNAGENGKCMDGVAPQISIEPKGLTNFIGRAATLSVGVSGSLPMSYQWYFQDAPLAQATNSSIAFPSLTVNHSGAYYVIISNSLGAATSSVAHVSVLSCITPATNIVGWWPFDGSYENLVSSNSGSFTGSSNSFVPGAVDMALGFNGSSKFVVPQEFVDLSQSTGFTVEGWIFPTSVDSARPIAEWYRGAHRGVHFYITVSGAANLYANIKTTEGQHKTFASAPGVVQLHTWQHVALTYDKGSGIGRIYLNGSIVAEQALGIFTPDTFTDLVFGHNPTHNHYFSGRMDEMAVYGRALSPQEIQVATGKCKPDLAPVITSGPADLVVFAGSNTNLTVVATGRPTPAFQWFFNEVPLAGETNAVLSFLNISPDQSGYYSLRVSNEVESVMSRTALVNVIPDGAPVVRISNIVSPRYAFTNASSVQVTLNSSISNATLFYTLDGREPDFTSTVYNGAFPVSGSRMIKAVAYDNSFSARRAQPVALQFYHTLSVTVLGGGSVAIDPMLPVYHDSATVQLSATSASQWGFVNWSGQASGTNSQIFVTMNQPRSVQAIFGTTINLTAVGAGSFHLNPSLPLFPYGSQVQIVAVPASNHHFALWGGGATGNVNPFTITITNAAPSISALFATLPENRFALTAIPNGKGTITVSPLANLFTNGQVVTITANPAQGQKFYRWTGDLASTNKSVSLVMNSSKVVQADFTGGAYSIRIDPVHVNSTNGLILFEVNGEPERVVSVQATADLTSWATVRSVTNSVSGTVQFTEPTTNAHRFYRAFLP
ncbi:MAG: LamG-like jellyroll fold domain-containing protein [Limisphaerales bacterium]